MTIRPSGEREKYPILGMDLCLPQGRVRASRLSDIRSECWGVAVGYGSVASAAPQKARPPTASSGVVERSEHSPDGAAAEHVLPQAVPIDRARRLPARQEPRQRVPEFRGQRKCSTRLVCLASRRRGCGWREKGNRGPDWGTGARRTRRDGWHCTRPVSLSPPRFESLHERRRMASPQ